MKQKQVEVKQKILCCFRRLLAAEIRDYSLSKTVVRFLLKSFITFDIQICIVLQREVNIVNSV